jgi:hypothetical protein
MKNREIIELLSKIDKTQNLIRAGVIGGTLSPAEVIFAMNHLDAIRSKLKISDEKPKGSVTSVYIEALNNPYVKSPKNRLIIQFNGSKLNDERTIRKNCGTTFKSK